MVHTSEKTIQDIAKKQFNNFKTDKDIKEFLNSGILKELGEPLCRNKYPFYKEKKTDKIWWVDYFGVVEGEMEFSFDLKKVYNYWGDYPDKLSKEEREIFKEEAPFWYHLRRGELKDCYKF